MALAVTINGGAVLIELKMTGSFAPSSAEQEALAMLKLSHKLVYLRTVAARCGKVQLRPSMLLCDAAASLRVAAGEISAARLRHALRQTAIITQRVRADEVTLAHVPDACQVVDFLTKWVSPAKEEVSLAYLCNFAARAAVEHGASEASAAVAMLVRLANVYACWSADSA